MAETLVLKKYANRRLYDTEKSAYVTLNQLADCIRQGRMVQIVDAKTNDDVTDYILTQIVLEEAKNKKALLPVPVLHMVIRYGDNLMMEFFEKYFHQTFQNYLSHKQAVDSQFQKWIEMGMNMSKVAQQSISGLNPFQSFMDPSGKAGKKGDEKK
jgi:polyhydroxyalkanoate synthesis repressor PhaR